MEQYVVTESYFGENSTYGSENEVAMTMDVTGLARSYLT